MIRFLPIVILLTACTFGSLAGRHADWLLLDRIDDHYDLTKAQEERLKPRVKALIAGLKQNELPTLIADLASLEERVAKGLSKQDLTWLKSRLVYFRTRLGDQIKTDAVWLLANLDTKQIQEIEEDITERRERWDERLNEDEEDDDRWEHYEERVEDWLGSTSKAQIELLRSHFAPIMTKEARAAHYDDRKQFQDRYLQVIKAKDPAQVEDFLTTWFNDPADLRSDKAREIYQQRMELFFSFLVKIKPTVSAEQRKHLLEKLKETRTTVIDFRKG